MLALFAISVLSFLVLFIAVLALLRRAKAEGARSVRLTRNTASFLESQPSQAVSQPVVASSEPSAVLFETSLSALVPDKQPDWRFMVRERRDTSRSRLAVARQPTSTEDPVSQRPDRRYSRADLGDLSDPYQSSPPDDIRRAG